MRATGPALCNGEPCPLPMKAPDFTAYDHNGKPVSLKQYEGKVVLLNFWASWCGVCKTEKPKLRKMAEEMVSDDFVVLTASRFALEHLAGEIAQTVNHSRRWTAQIEALANAADAIELALAED